MKDETASVISAAAGGVVAIIGDHEPAQTAHPAVEQQADQGTREARVGDQGTTGPNTGSPSSTSDEGIWMRTADIKHNV